MVKFGGSIPIPGNEEERLQALLELDILDTEPEERFDRLTRLASRLTETPTAVVSLVDAQRQWFKSKVGLDAAETPREVAFCAHTIMGSELLVVGDAHEDARFSDNPLVTGAPGIRFYAGAPLTLSDGVHLGALCAIDTEPREMTDDQREALHDLAQIVIDELHLRQRIIELRRVRAELETANQSLEHFAHLAAHDLRAPMKTLTNLADLASVSTGEVRDDALAHLREVAAQADAIVAGYRRLSMLKLGDISRCRVADMVEEARRDTGPDIRVTLEGDAEIEGDGVLLGQVVRNLLGNAAKHGSGDLLSIQCAIVEQTVTLRFENRVAEQSPLDETVLAPFQRGGGDAEGEGLGLAVVHRIVQLHGGSVSVESDGRSFAIVIELPERRRRG